MKVRNIIGYLVIFASGIIVVKAQKIEDFCKSCKVNKEVVCVSSKELKKRTVFINELYAPSTTGLTRIRDKTVFVNVLVNTEGKVVEAIATRGHPALKGLAVVIARNAKFSPMKVGNEPKNMCGRLVLKWNPNK